MQQQWHPRSATRSSQSSPHLPPPPPTSPPPLHLLLSELSALASSTPRGRVFLHGVGREGLMMRALGMRLFHLGLPAHIVGDMTTPPIASGDLLLASAGPGEFSTVTALCKVTKSSGGRVVLITANPDAVKCAADVVVHLPAQTMADGEEEEEEGEVRLPMGSLYEGAMFVLFEMLVIRLKGQLKQSAAEMRARHTNLE